MGSSEKSQGMSYEFFKIMLEHNPSNNTKLELPKKFVRLYGESLPDTVYLKVRCGGVRWRVGVLKRVGAASFEQGWPEFVSRFSIAHGHLLFFTYRGNDEFGVSICDKTTCQIDYPEPSVTETDDSVRSLDDDDDEDDDYTPDQSESEKGYPNDDEDSEGSVSETREAEDAGYKPKRGKGRSFKDFKGTRAFREASEFTSEYPFFRTIVRNHSYLNQRVPKRFGNGHFEQRSQTVRLEVGKRSWKVSFVVCPSGHYLCGGYPEFLKANSLLIGDVCIYELIRRGGVTLRVSIFRQKAR